MGEFRLVMCDARGAPVEPLGLSQLQVESARQGAEHYARVGYAPPWVGYIAVADDMPVGGGAFVCAPVAGRVEIAYFTEPEFERRGHAGMTARTLVEIARATAPGILVFAKTLPEANASTRILERLGFAFAGETTDEDVGLAWLWELAPRRA